MEETSKYIDDEANNKYYYRFDINKIWELFINRADTYLVQNPDGSYIRVDEPLTPEIIQQHLEGRHTIAIYSLSMDSTAKWICFDFDEVDAEIQAKKLYEYLQSKQYKNSMLVEHTGNRGYHVWIFFKPMKAEYLVWIGRKIAENAGLGIHELFPKHTELNERVRFGDAVKLPFGIHRKTGNRSELIYPSDIEEIVPLELPEEIQRKIQVELLKTETYSSLETPMKPIPWWTRCKVYETILKYGVPEGHRDESAFLLARIFRDQGLLEEEAFERLKQWNEKNSPPLDSKILRIKVKQAYTKKYAVGFRSIIKNNVLKIFCPTDCNECKYSSARSENENSKIDLEYIEGKTWRVIGVGNNKLTITIKKGRDLLTRSEFKWLRKKIGNIDKVIELAEKVEEKYNEQKDEEGTGILTMIPSWAQNIKLLDIAQRYLDEKLELFRQMLYPANIYAYHEWLRSEVFANLLAGEEENKVTGFVILVLGRNYLYGLWGPSTLGKTYFIDQFMELIYDRLIVINRVTEKGIDYIPEKIAEGKVLYVKEVKVAEGHTFFVLKALEDDGTYVLAYPVRDPKTGRTRITIQRLKLAGFATTSNKEDVFEIGLIERVLTQKLDASPAQNRRVLAFQDEMRYQQTLIKLGKASNPWTNQEWSKALCYLLRKKIEAEEFEIIIPFHHLNQILLEPFADQLDVKRLGNHLPQFLEWFSRLFLFFLPEVKGPNNKKFKLLTVELLELALYYFLKTIEAKSELKKPGEIKFAERLCKYLKEKGLGKSEKENAEDENLIVLGKVARKLLAKELGVSEGKIRRELNNLTNLVPLAVTAVKLGREIKFQVNLDELTESLKELVKENEAQLLFNTEGKLLQNIRLELEKDLNIWMEENRELLIEKIISENELHHTNEKNPEIGFSSQDICSELCVSKTHSSEQISDQKELSSGFSDLFNAVDKNIIAKNQSNSQEYKNNKEVFKHG
jgi:hypothetical protein